jgi:hypothetical protein
VVRVAIATASREERRGEETGVRLGVGATQNSRAVLTSGGDVHVGAGSPLGAPALLWPRRALRRSCSTTPALVANVHAPGAGDGEARACWAEIQGRPEVEWR